MKLDPEAEIPEDKLTEYLLALHPRNDKSAFFASAGYSQSDWTLLRRDLRDQILPLDAQFSRHSGYGDLYTIAGRLHGPNGSYLHILSVWIVDEGTGTTRLVTAYPA